MTQKEQEPQSRHLFIAAVGVTGSGKTTFVRMGLDLGFRVIEEPNFAQDAAFKNYYGAPKDNAFNFQINILTRVCRQLGGKERSDLPPISDVLMSSPVFMEPFYEQHKLYAKARFGDNRESWELYQSVYEVLFGKGNFPVPDILIYLKISYENMLKRIEKRAELDPTRKEELLESREYWKRLWDLHEEWIRENPLNLRIVTINRDDYDFSKYPNEEEGREALLYEFLNQSRYACIDQGTDKPKIPGITIPDSIKNHRPVTPTPDIPPGLPPEQKMVAYRK